MNNLAKDMTKRELAVLILTAGMMPIGDDEGWIKKYGEEVIDTAELMADKLMWRSANRVWGVYEIVPQEEKEAEVANGE